jgi:hypothetical protein
MLSSYLYEAAHAQVLLDDDVVHCSHDESDLHRVGGACEVGVDLLCGMLIEAKSLSVSNISCKSNGRDFTYETNRLRM